MIDFIIWLFLFIPIAGCQPPTTKVCGDDCFPDGVCNAVCCWVDIVTIPQPSSNYSFEVQIGTTPIPTPKFECFKTTRVELIIGEGYNAKR